MTHLLRLSLSLHSSCRSLKCATLRVLQVCRGCAPHIHIADNSHPAKMEVGNKSIRSWQILNWHDKEDRPTSVGPRFFYTVAQSVCPLYREHLKTEKGLYHGLFPSPVFLWALDPCKCKSCNQEKSVQKSPVNFPFSFRGSRPSENYMSVASQNSIFFF